MADTFDMEDFIAEVRRLGGFESLDEANSFVTDTEIESRGNANMRKVYLALVRARGANYFRAYTDFDTEVGLSTYDIPAAFLELLSMSRKVGDGWVPIWDFQESERDDFNGQSGVEWPFTANGSPVRFQLRGQQLEVAPSPATIDTLRLFYVPAYTPITKAGGEAFDGVAGFQEWAIWETLAELQAKDSADWQLSMTKAAWWEREVESMARQRNAGTARRVNRVRRRRRSHGIP